jgi:hypothetical protein
MRLSAAVILAFKLNFRLFRMPWRTPKLSAFWRYTHGIEYIYCKTSTAPVNCYKVAVDQLIFYRAGMKVNGLVIWRQSIVRNWTAAMKLMSHDD